MRRFLQNVRKTLWLALEHDVFNTSKAAAYSGMLCFFPAVLVMAAMLAQVPRSQMVIVEMRSSMADVLPPGTMTLLENSLQAQKLRPLQVIGSAGALSVFAGAGVMLSLMEGFRRAYRVRRDTWGLWQKQARALMLVPIVLLPLALASLLLVFGHEIELWMIVNAGHELRGVVLFFWRMVRWTVAVSTGVAVLAALYHFGTKRTEHWAWVLPGAVAATALWFPATLAFGFYVTRVTDYSRFYGSFAAGIATLVWLFLTSFSALLGAELNGVLYQDRLETLRADHAADAVSSGL